jgi:hypothetical protein
VTPDQILKPLRIIDDVQRRRLTEAVMTPEVRRAMRDARAGILGTQLREQIESQIDFQKMLRPALFEQMQEQNAAIREMLHSSGIRRAMASFDFKLPEGMAAQVAAFKEQLEAELADPGLAEERAGRLAEERETIIKFLRRVGLGVEGFSYLPGSPIPSLVGFVILLLAMLSEVADEILTEREDDK